MDVYLGVDWSAKELVCALLVGDSPKVLERRGVKRQAASVASLMEWTRKKSEKDAVIHAIIEDGAEGWVRLLHAAGAVVHVVNTARAAAFGASMCSSRAKDDKRDAIVLAHLGRSPAHCPPAWEPPDEQHTQLVLLSRLHETLTEETGRVEQRLRSVLREHFPALEGVFWDRGQVDQISPFPAYVAFADLHRAPDATWETRSSRPSRSHGDARVRVALPDASRDTIDVDGLRGGVQVQGENLDHGSWWALRGEEW